METYYEVFNSVTKQCVFSSPIEADCFTWIETASDKFTYYTITTLYRRKS